MPERIAYGVLYAPAMPAKTLTRGSKAANFSAYPPPRQIPTAPIRPGSTSGRARRNDTAARRSASLPCGSSWRRGWPPDSPEISDSTRTNLQVKASRFLEVRDRDQSRVQRAAADQTAPGRGQEQGGSSEC